MLQKITHPAVLEKIRQFNVLYVQNSNGRLSRSEIRLFFELRDALQRIGRDASNLVKVA